ncbi:transcriptional regulator (plasmid) [Citrobacter freundii]|uniref:HTH-type transcriptional regulator MerD n=1 Tax=Citrobacter freundii TaxID=546 RepID=A0A0K2S3T3_CITFR|nr:transcriptional regulator MerD [Citrobacter freundii]BBM27970.1 transcriptional regulator [Enterobacter hormaechei subsp. hoffmannii]BEJ31214.1 transcriptional regulator [Escherichia coli]BEJ37251.1 transcriptional regulator [Citrobacter freundii]BEJ43211.1 transcriptional regulator [Citrobacter freundii]
MSAYTVSQLAHNAGVSVHIVRDYLVRGLLRPVACTTGGYGVFDDAALQRLCFVRAAFEAGIGLDALARLCRALDAADGAQAAAQLAVLRQLVERRRAALAHLDAQLASMPAERAGYRKYKPPFCSSSEVSYLKFPHSFTAQAPILTAGPA